MKVRCSKCKAVHNISEEKLKGKSGKVKVRCPKCRAILVIPASGRSTESEDDKGRVEAAPAAKPEWYYAREGAQAGPVTLPDLRQLFASGAMPMSTLVWRPGLDTWTEAAGVPEFAAATAGAAERDVPATPKAEGLHAPAGGDGDFPANSAVGGSAPGALGVGGAAPEVETSPMHSEAVDGGGSESAQSAAPEGTADIGMEGSEKPEGAAEGSEWATERLGEAKRQAEEASEGAIERTYDAEYTYSNIGLQESEHEPVAERSVEDSSDAGPSQAERHAEDSSEAGPSQAERHAEDSSEAGPSQAERHAEDSSEAGPSQEGGTDSGPAFGAERDYSPEPGQEPKPAPATSVYETVPAASPEPEESGLSAGGDTESPEAEGYGLSGGLAEESPEAEGYGLSGGGGAESQPEEEQAPRAGAPDGGGAGRLFDDLPTQVQAPVYDDDDRPLQFPESGPQSVAAQRGQDGDDLFAAFDAAPGKGQGDQPVRKAQEMLYTRRETSVLFSLDDLTKKKGDRDTAPAEVGQAKADDSGLIDIRQVALGTQAEDLFAGIASQPRAVMSSDPQQSIVADLGGLSMPVLRKRRRSTVVAAFVAVSVVAVAALGYGGYVFVTGMGGSVELVGQVLASASERAFKQKVAAADQVRENGRAKLEAAKKSADDAIAAAAAKAEEEMKALQVKTAAQMAELGTSNEKALIELQSSVDKAREAAEKRKALLAAASAPAETVGSPAGTGAAVVPGTEKATGKEPEKKKELSAKEKDKGKSKEKDKKEVSASDALISGAKKEEKKEEKKEVAADEKKEKDPAALLKMIDEKKGAEAEDGGAAAATGKKTLTTTDIMKVVNGNKGKMRDCFTKYGAGLESATIRTKITIQGSTGTVTEIQISSMEFAGTALGNCVGNIQKKMKFPTFASQSLSKTISVRLP